MAKIITAHTGTPHITSDDAAALQKAIIGDNDYLVGDNPAKFKATLLDNNVIQLSEGEVVIQGTHVRIQATDKVTIAAGQAGLNRIDIIAVCYSKTEAGIESAELKVLSGKAAVSPTAPTVTQADIRNGALYHEMPLFTVNINGTAIDSVTMVCETVQSLSAAFKQIANNASSIGKLNEYGTEIEKMKSNQILWSGAFYMNASQVANLSAPISEQTHGIILVFSGYGSGQVYNDDVHCFIFPKYLLGQGKMNCKYPLFGGLASVFGLKGLYISDSTITGHANNTAAGHGVLSYNNSAFVLRYVIGF